MTMPVSVVNEFGERETHRVFKEDYLTRLKIFPFRNESGDSSRNWMAYGIQLAVLGDLEQFNYILTGRTGDAIILQEQIEFANTHDYSNFLTGTFRMNDGSYEITTRLYQTTNGSILAERNFRGNDFFSLMDSISLQTRIDLNVSDYLLQSIPDLPFKEHYTNNLDAFRYFTIGSAIDSIQYYLNKAIKLDPTFAVASYERARYNHQQQLSRESAKKDINQAMEYRQRLIQAFEIRTRILYYEIHGERDKAIALAEMERQLKPYDYDLLNELTYIYIRNLLFQKWEKAESELYELAQGAPTNQIWLASAYQFNGKLDKGQRILEELLERDPRNTEALFRLGEIYLHQNKLDKAEELYKRVSLIKPELNGYCSTMLDHCTYVRNHRGNSINHTPYVGKYRMDLDEMYGITSILNEYLVLWGENQGAIFCYPISDSQYITEYISGPGPAKLTFLKNKEGKVSGIFLEQVVTVTQWKEDSLILKAREQLNNDSPFEALSTFRLAYDQNPEHYYLAHYIRHLEYIQSPEYKKSMVVLKSYTGDYANHKIYYDKDQFYYETNEGLIYKLLPMDEDHFMIPSILNCLFQIEKEDDSISGLRMIYHNGEEKFYPRFYKQAHVSLNN